VIKEPERRAASTITTPTERPEISRLRRGKSRARLPGERHFRNTGAVGQNLLQQVAVFGRIDVLMPAGQHRNGSARKTCAVRGGIDPARQARHDAEPGCAQIARERLREFNAGGGRIARADDGDQRPRQDVELAAHRQRRRRIVDHL
jgi:hypothetical protein